MRHQLCTDTWWITLKNLFNLFILGLWEGWIMLPVIWTVEFTILFLLWIFCAITMSSDNGTQLQIWWSCDTMIQHHNVTTPFAFGIKAEYELNIYFMISYNLKTCFFSHVRCLMSRSEQSSAQKRRKDGSFSADYCDVQPTTFSFLFLRN